MQYFYSGGTAATTTVSSTTATSPPVYYIMFSASGGVDALYIGGVRTPVSRPIYILVGKPEQAKGLGVINIKTNPPPHPTRNDEDLDNGPGR